MATFIKFRNVNELNNKEIKQISKFGCDVWKGIMRDKPLDGIRFKYRLKPYQMTSNLKEMIWTLCGQLSVDEFDQLVDELNEFNKEIKEKLKEEDEA